MVAQMMVGTALGSTAVLLVEARASVVVAVALEM